ncbi:MAG TPA: thioesterase family protein [Bacillota bacterium]|nr:thioesterase family protein [Bacillota bacterium]
MKINETDIDVRYQETDQMGVVYHANYLVWFEIGRTKFIQSIGLNYKDMEDAGYVSPVTHADVHYKLPIRYGDDVIVRTWIDYYDGMRTIYGYEIIGADEKVAVTGTTTHVIVDKQTFRPKSLRREFPDWHEIYDKETKRKRGD